MADPSKRLSTNVAGDFFVDSTCINCDTCRQLAPDVFGEKRGYSFVKDQPDNEGEMRAATRALLCCPTGSIGNQGKNIAKEVQSEFPQPLDKNVYYCGFNSARSYGANSYFVTHPDGNWLIDSPKFLPYLAKRLREMGGISYIFLTHRDDVADADKYAAEFNAKRIIHRRDADACPGAEIKIEGEEATNIATDFLVIPTPGHTSGHAVLLYGQLCLFTGDHLAWDRDTQELVAWPDVCWYDWEQQKQSLEKLVPYSFEWLLPGHGDRIKLPPDRMKQAMRDLIGRLESM